MDENTKEILTDALDRFESSSNYDKNQRELAVEDRLFAHAPDGQWDDDAIKRRENRPRYTINKVAGAIDQVTGDQRQSRTGIKVIPVVGESSEQVAKILSGIIRTIETRSNAADSYNNAFDEMTSGGYGGWRVTTDYAEGKFDQEINIAPISSADTSLFFDPDAVQYDKRDAKFAFVITTIDSREFKRRWPDASIIDWKQVTLNRTTCQSWFGNDTVRVAEYWVKEPTTKEIALLSDGRIIDVEEEGAVIDDLALQGATVIKRRKQKAHNVVVYKMSGAEILEGRKEWAGKYIPLIPTYGKTTTIEGKPYIRGIVRNAKDPSRIYNYLTSSIIEAGALAPKDPIWITAHQAAGYEAELNAFPTANSPFMLYNADAEAPGIPQRGGAPAVQVAAVQQLQQAGMDIHATTGLEPASLGNSPELKSGKAIMAQQAMGDRGSFVFVDNQSKSIEYTGEILVDLIPKVHDVQQMIRSMDVDGSSEEIEINAKALDAIGQPVLDRKTGEVVIVNDLSRGGYSVVVESGPAYHTQRQETAQQLIDLATNSEEFEQVSLDLIAKNLPILEGAELTKRIRRVMISKGVIDPTEEEAKELGQNQQPEGPSEQEQALIDSLESQTVLNTSSAMNKDADTYNKEMQAQQRTIETYQTLVETITSKIAQGLPISGQEVAIMELQRSIVLEGQADVLEEEEPGEQPQQML